jgi:hypothetical protein
MEILIGAKSSMIEDFDGHYRGELVPLFHPRRDEWNAHFRWQGMQIEGVSPVGRATVQVLAMNDARRLELRTEWMMLGGVPDV